MKQALLLIIKGFLIGIGKVIPGVSGSLIALSLGVYEKSIHMIGHFFKNIKDSIFYLGTLAVGILISVAFGSKLIAYALEFFYFPTMLLFIGFIMGGLPSIYQKGIVLGKKNKLYFLGAVLFIVIISCFSSSSSFTPSHTLISYFSIFMLGFLDATTMIIPGISGTAIYMILGCYPFILDLFASISTPFTLFSNLRYFIWFGSGLILGIFLVSYFMDYVFHKHQAKIYATIFGFSISSILILIMKTFQHHFNFLDLLFGTILFIIGYQVAHKFDTE